MRGAPDDEVEERGVELGLSLGANKNQNSTAPARRGPACRILTAKDFAGSIAGPSRVSRASPSPSQSSSVSSSSVRAADSDSGTDAVVGSTSPDNGSGSAYPSRSVPFLPSLFYIFPGVIVSLDSLIICRVKICYFLEHSFVKNIHMLYYLVRHLFFYVLLL